MFPHTRHQQRLLDEVVLGEREGRLLRVVQTVAEPVGLAFLWTTCTGSKQLTQ